MIRSRQAESARASCIGHAQSSAQGWVLAIALNFYRLHAIGLGAIDAAVRLRSCDCAVASRIDALSLTLSIHLFTSGRAETFPRGLCTTKATSPLDGKPI